MEVYTTHSLIHAHRYVSNVNNYLKCDMDDEPSFRLFASKQLNHDDTHGKEKTKCQEH